MRILSVARFAACVALLVGGCDKSQSQPVATSATPPSSASSAAAPTESPPKTSGSPQASGQSDTAASAHETTDQSQKVTKKEPVSELIAGIKNPVLVKQFESVQKQAHENPTDWKAQASYVRLLQLIGQERMRSQETDRGYATFSNAGDEVWKFLATKPEIPEAAQSVFAEALYNDACAASLGDHSKRAMESLQESINRGFSDFSLIEKDPDLVSLRTTPEFAEKLAGWKASAREKVMKKAKEELAAGKSFAFDFALTDVEGKPIKLADYKGKVVIVDIWGTWCPPCRAEIPSFVRLQNELGEKGFQMIGLNKESKSGDEGNKLVKSFMTKEKMNYPCALIDEATQDQVPDFEGYPTTLFVDRSGKVRLKAVGLHEYEYLESVVQALLDEPT
jgi:thiol-disulfide isomerase/thioredoxin